MLKRLNAIILIMTMLCSRVHFAFAENTFSGTIGSGDKTTTGWQVFNADGADVSNGEDPTYGVTAVLSAAEAKKNTAFGKTVNWGETDNLLQMEFAVKRNNIGGADVAVEGWGVEAKGKLAEPNGTQFVNFASDGNIYYYGKNQNGDRKVLIGPYETAVWYEVSVSYLPGKGRIIGVINGGVYNDRAFATSGFVKEKFTELDVGFRSTNGKGADAHFGYVNFEVSDTTVAEGETFECDFNDFNVGEFYGSGGSLGKFDIPPADKPYVKIAQSDAEHGNSVLFTHEGAYVDQLQYRFSQAISDEKLAVEYSVLVGSGTGFELIVDGSGSDSVSGTSGYFYAMSMGTAEGTVWLGSRFGNVPADAVNFSWQYGKWYRIKMLFDMAAKKMIMQIGAEGSDDVVRSERSINGFSSLTQLGFGVESRGAATYLDNLKIYKTDTAAEVLPDKVFLYNNASGAWADNRRCTVPKPYISQDEVFVPVAMTAALLGAEITSDGSDNLSFRFGDSDYSLTADNGCFRKDTSELPLSRAAELKGGIMYVTASDLSAILNTEFFTDSCGYILLGNGVGAYDLNNKTDKQLLDRVAKSVIFDSTTGEEVAALLKAKNPNNEHPRLMVRSEDIPALRQKVYADATVSSWTNGFLNYVNRSSMKRELPTYKLTDVRLNVSREVKLTLGELAFAYIITGENQYADEAIKVMMRVCDSDYFPDWNPYHFLDVGDMAGGVAIAYDWCYDRMTAEQREQVKSTLTEYALKEIMRDYTYDSTRRRTWSWSDPKSSAYPQNWVAVCGGGVDLAALAIGAEDDVSALAGNVIALGNDHMKDLLLAFGPDGAWFEGPGYWEYAYEYFALAMNSMETALGTDFRLTEGPGFKKAAYYIIGNAGPTATFNLNDCLESLYNSANSPEFMWLANISGDAALAKYRMKFIENGYSSYSYKDILWYNPEYAKDDMKIPEDGVWRELNVASSRTGYEKTDLYAAIHGGEEGRDIGDLDYGTFVIDNFNKRWALDLGKDNANYKSDKDGKTRWDYYRCRGEGHNTVILNPDGGNDQDKDAICPITRFDHNDDAMYAVTDLTAAHAYRGAKSVVRGMYVDKVTETVTIQDEIEMNKPSEMYWFMHTKADISIGNDGRTAVLSQGGYRMGVSLAGDENLKFTQMQAVPLGTSPKPSDMEDDSAVNKLVIHATGIVSEKFAVRIYPLTSGEDASVITDDCTPISAWSVESDAMISNMSLKKTVTDGKIKITAYAVAENVGRTPQKIMFVAAAYDAKGGLKDCAVVDKDVSGISSAELSASVSATADGRMRLFAWDKYSLKPYTKCVDKLVGNIEQKG